MAEEVRVLSFQSLVTLPRGRELSRALANALMTRQIAQNANVRIAAARLQLCARSLTCMRASRVGHEARWTPWRRCCASGARRS